MGSDYNVYLMVRRKKMTLFLNTPENVRVYKLKKMIEGKFTRNIQRCDKIIFLIYHELQL